MTGTDDSKKRGINALTGEHHRRWARGLASFADIAREVGMTKQGVSQAFQRRGWTMENAPSNPESVKPPTAALDDVLLPEAERLRILAASQRTLVGANLRLIGEIDGLLAREKGSLGVTNIGTLARALQACSDNVVRLLAREDDAVDELESFEVRVMTEEQQAEVAERAQREAEGLDGVLVEEDADDGLGSAVGTPDAPDRRSGPGSAGPSPTDLASAPAVPPAPAARPRLPGPLPMPDHYRAWLLDIGERHGRRVLRQIAGALDRPAGVGTPPDVLVETIITATRGDPDRLRSVVDAR